MLDGAVDHHPRGGRGGGEPARLEQPAAGHPALHPHVAPGVLPQPGLEPLDEARVGHPRLRPGRGEVDSGGESLEVVGVLSAARRPAVAEERVDIAGDPAEAAAHDPVSWPSSAARRSARYCTTLALPTLMPMRAADSRSEQPDRKRSSRMVR